VFGPSAPRQARVRRGRGRAAAGSGSRPEPGLAASERPRLHGCLHRADTPQERTASVRRWCEPV